MLIINPSLLLGASLALLAATFWGLGSLFVKISVGSMSYLKGMVLRGIFAFPSLLLIAIPWSAFVESFDLMAPLSPSIVIITVLSALALLMGDIFFLVAMSKADVSFSYPIASTYPFFAAIYLFFLQVEEFTEPVIVGTILIVMGVMAVSRVQQHDTAQVKDKRRGSKSQAFLFALLSAIFWGAAVTTLKIILSNGVHPLALNVQRVWIILVMALAIGMIVDRLNFELKNDLAVNPKKMFNDKKQSLAMGVSGILAWTFGGTAFLVAINMIGANRATPISAVTPFVGSILGVLFLKERLSTWHVIGLLLIVAGSVLLVTT